MVYYTSSDDNMSLRGIDSKIPTALDDAGKYCSLLVAFFSPKVLFIFNNNGSRKKPLSFKWVFFSQFV